MGMEEQGEVSLFPVDTRWLAKTNEPVIEPELPIVDPHHHLWAHHGRYLLDEFLTDISSGHNITSTMHVQCDSMYRIKGDALLAPLGETEFCTGVAAMCASGQFGATQVCAGMVGFAPLSEGERAAATVLDKHMQIAGVRFRGVRHCSVWDADTSIRTTPMDFPEGLLHDTRFREGFACLGKRGLAFDGWLYHPQIPEFADLANAFPDTPMIIDHIGAPLAVGVYEDMREEVFSAWRENMTGLARCPNVNVKIGGMGMHIFGFGFDKQDAPPGSKDLAKAWRPYVDTCIELFGVNRCMFESNFPVDKLSYSYAVLWNAFKRLAQGCSADEKAALFSETAQRVYGLAVR